MSNALSDALIDIARSAQSSPVAMRRGLRLIAGFASARDAQVFAGLKREEGQDVTVTTGRPDSPYLWEVHALARSL